jgi:MYXO-CTERM domain-containing protein
MQRYCPFLILYAFLTASACAQRPHAASASSIVDARTSQAIVHGRKDEATDLFDAVVMLSFPDARTMCSGTLIAPDTVLTAAHCIPQAWGVGTGVQRLSGSQRLEILFHRGPAVRTTRLAQAVAIHDAYRGLLRCGRPIGQAEQKACDAFARHCGGVTGVAQEQCLSTLDRQVRRGLGLDRLWPTHDVAVVFLDAPVTDVALARIADDRFGSNLVHAHAPVIVAGYGQQGDTQMRPGMIGQIVHGHNHIVEAGVGELRVDGGDRAHPCFGDSGGPVFAEVDHEGVQQLVQVGVASRVWDYHAARGCASGLAYTRVDDEGGFIGGSLRDACIEGARVQCDAGSDPLFAARAWREHESCSQGSASWGWMLLIVLWFFARRRRHRAA